tara:strand:+ start:6227 stop:6661 length:435 start_codon:yes stop_codon:yes gene_type:complete
MEDVLVERIIHCFWGLRRARRVFNELHTRVAQGRRNQQFLRSNGGSLPLEQELGWAFEAVSGTVVDRLDRHEVRLERGAYRSLQALEQLRTSEFPLAADTSAQLGLFDAVDSPKKELDKSLVTRSGGSITDLARLPRVPRRVGS